MFNSNSNSFSNRCGFNKILKASIVLFLLTLLFVNSFQTKTVSAVSYPTPVTKKVMILNFNPYVQENTDLVTYQGWHDDMVINNTLIEDAKWASHNYVNYQIVERYVVRDYPVKPDGFKFTNEQYLGCLNDNSPSYCLQIIDYNKLINDYNLCGRVNSGLIDEVWLWGGPYFGYYESALAGPNAFWYNSPPILGTSCNKHLPIMGYNYERNDAALHAFGHRAESVMDHIFGYYSYNPNINFSNTWSRFVAFDNVSYGKASCGNVHFPPNGINHYDYSNWNYVASRCSDWLNYPSSLGSIEFVNCTSWGCGYNPDNLYFEKWWLYHFPNKTGTTNNKLNNWWAYVVDYDNAIQSTSNEKWYTIENGMNDSNNSCVVSDNDNEIYIGVNNNCKPARNFTATLKFPDVRIAKNELIKEAYLEVVADGVYTNSLRENIKLSDGTTTSGKVVWQISEQWDYPQTIKRSPDLKTALQTVVNSTSWSFGKQLTVTIEHQTGSGHRRFFAVEREANAGARLVIITDSGVPTPTPTVTPTPTTTPSPSPTPTPTVTPTPTPTPTLENLLLNPGFELDINSDGKPDGWTVNNNFTRSNSTVRSGSFSGLHSANNNANYIVSQTVNVTSGSNYSFEGWTYIPITRDSFTFNIQVTWKDVNGGDISTSLVKSYNGATGGWNQAYANIVAPTGAINAQVKMNLTSLKASVFVDDFSFKVIQ